MLSITLIDLPPTLTTYEAHQLVWKAFPKLGRGEARPFLFRLQEHTRHCSLLVQSRLKPDWSFLEGAATVREKTLDASAIKAGATFDFCVRANPTEDRKGFADRKQRRVPVGSNPAHAFRRMGSEEAAPSTGSDQARWRQEELKKWLDRQAQRCGFTTLRVEAGPTYKRHIHRGGSRMTLHEVEFTGRLVVDDPAAFARTCAEGIGRGKSFGFGLLMIRQAPQRRG